MLTPLSFKGSTCSLASIAMALVVLATPVRAGIELELGDVAGSGWSATAVRIEVSYPQGAGMELEVSARTVELPGIRERLEQFSLACSRTSLGGKDWRCDPGVLGFEFQGQPVTTSYRLTYIENVYALELPKVEWEGLSFAATVRYSDGSWSTKLHLVTDDLSKTASFVSAIEELGLGWLGGSMVLDLALEGEPSSVRGDAVGELQEFAFSDESGLRAGEGLGIGVQASFSRQGPEWHFDSVLRLDSGEIVFDNFYLDASGPPREISAAGEWSDVSDRLELQRFEIRHPGVLSASGSLQAELGDTLKLTALELSLPRTSLPAVYRDYLQSLFLGSPFERLELEGELEAQVQWRQDESGQADIELHDVNLEDEAGNFAIYGLKADLRWSGKETPDASRIEWSGGSVYTLDVGPGILLGELQEDQFRLSQTVSVPVLDGRLVVNKLNVDGLGSTLGWQMSGGLSPVTMETLCHALGWPPFSGTLAGSVPGVDYHKGELTTNGAMVMRVFDGEVLIRDLRLVRPFGVVPELHANVDAWNLDLEQLTRAFSFGDIQGKLDGQVHRLVLQDWEPVSFDAKFATPDNDSSRHRISQNAVDNLARIGGGSGALSSTFLRFLDEFSYDRLGLSCRLKNGVCEMGGVESSERGYYIVKGGGFPPRIDVLGFNNRVAWKGLVDRLKNIEAPIIE